MEYLQISAERLRRSLPEVFVQVEGARRSYLVTRNGRPALRIVPVEPEQKTKSAAG